MLISYGCVATSKRYQLIELVYKQNVGIKEAAEQIGINYQTAKSIIRRFRQTGKIERINKIVTPPCDGNYHHLKDQPQFAGFEQESGVEPNLLEEGVVGSSLMEKLGDLGKRKRKIINQFEGTTCGDQIRKNQISAEFEDAPLKRVRGTLNEQEVEYVRLMRE